MYRRFKLPNFSLLFLTSLLIVLSSNLSAKGRISVITDNSACNRTAYTMLRACQADAKDDLYTTLANCQNIAEGETRMSCLADAWASKREENEHCSEVYEARNDACELLGENRYDPDPLRDTNIEFIDPDAIPDEYPANPYVSIAAGHTYVLRAGEEGEETVVVHASNETREIQGVLCRVVVDIAVEVEEEDGAVEYSAVEATDDWMAQDVLGNVYYCGEISRNYEDGVLVDIDGSFEAGKDYAKAGTLIKAFPVTGTAHRQEFSLSEAEDIIQYLSLATGPTEAEGGDNEAFPCAVDQCIKTFDFTPIDPESTEFKFYRPGVGFVLAVAMEDGELTGEREELVCVGESLEILHNPGCGIADPDALLEELCKLSPDAFCED